MSIRPSQQRTARSESSSGQPWLDKHYEKEIQTLVFCAMVIAFVALCKLLQWLSELLIPFCFALLLYFLVNPMVDQLCDAPQLLASCINKIRRNAILGGHPASPERDADLEEEKRDSTRGSSRENVPLLSTSSGPTRQNQAETGSYLHRFFRRLASSLLVKRIPRWIAILVSIFLVLSVIMVFVAYVTNQVTYLLNHLGPFTLFIASSVTFGLSAPLLVQYEDMATKMQAELKRILQRLDLDFDNDLVPYLITLVKNIAGSIVSWSLNFAEVTFLTLAFLLFLLIYPLRPGEGAWPRITEDVKNYIRLKTMLSVAMGFIVGVTLWLLGVQVAGLFGVVAFFCNYIPNVGALFSTLAPLPLVVFDPRLSPWTQALAIALPGTIHFAWGNFFEPQYFGDQLDLHPIIVMLALGFWTIIWATPGAFLSVPLLAILRIILSQLDHPTAHKVVGILEGDLFMSNPDSTGGGKQEGEEAAPSGEEESKEKSR